MKAHPAVSHARTAAPLLALLLTVVAAPASAANIHISLETPGENITIDDDDVVIEVDAEEARISRDGDLTIDGKRQRVSARDRDDLIRYNATMHWLEDRAVDIGLQGAGLAVVAIGEAVAAALTGEEDGVERRVEVRAERLKDDVRELCAEMRRLEGVQDRLAARLRSFRPFAVMEMDADDCRVDD